MRLKSFSIENFCGNKDTVTYDDCVDMTLCIYLKHETSK